LGTVSRAHLHTSRCVLRARLLTGTHAISHALTGVAVFRDALRREDDAYDDAVDGGRGRLPPSQTELQRGRLSPSPRKADPRPKHTSPLRQSPVRIQARPRRWASCDSPSLSFIVSSLPRQPCQTSRLRVRLTLWVGVCRSARWLWQATWRCLYPHCSGSCSRPAECGDCTASSGCRDGQWTHRRSSSADPCLCRGF
jgi:hypothetical protein